MNLDADQSKLLAMFLLGGGSFLVGMMPGYLSVRHQERHKVLITILLCFGAGVLLATSIVHILSEVQETLPQTAAIYFCGGFFLVYCVDVLMHTIFSESAQTPENSRNYGTIATAEADSERNALLAPATNNETAPVPNVQCPNSNRAGKYGLLAALSLHSLLEGLAIGVQDTSAKVLILVTAVACHKYVVGFCLGLEVNSGSSDSRASAIRTLFLCMLIFAFGSVMGIAIGMALVDYEQFWSSSTIPILQAIAGGTLLYVTVCEVLPREKAKYHQRSKSTIVWQLVAMLVGFTVMTLMNTFLGEFSIMI